MPKWRRARSSTSSTEPVRTTSGWPSPARDRRSSSRLSAQKAHWRAEASLLRQSAGSTTTSGNTGPWTLACRSG